MLYVTYEPCEGLRRKVVGGKLEDVTPEMRSWLSALPSRVGRDVTHPSPSAALRLLVDPPSHVCRSTYRLSYVCHVRAYQPVVATLQPRPLPPKQQNRTTVTSDTQGHVVLRRHFYIVVVSTGLSITRTTPREPRRPVGARVISKPKFFRNSFQ